MWTGGACGRVSDLCDAQEGLIDSAPARCAWLCSLLCPLYSPLSPRGFSSQQQSVLTQACLPASMGCTSGTFLHVWPPACPPLATFKSFLTSLKIVKVNCHLFQRRDDCQKRGLGAEGLWSGRALRCRWQVFCTLLGQGARSQRGWEVGVRGRGPSSHLPPYSPAENRWKREDG